MSPTRRDFLKTISAATLSIASGGGHALVGLLPGIDVYPHAGDPELKELAARALEAARAAGATYADVRFTLTRVEELRFLSASSYSHHADQEYAGVGVRALVDGAWGFASSTLWTPDEVARLGTEAAVQARHNAAAGRRRVELGPPPAPASGEWKTPIQRDPFDVPLADKIETAWAFLELASRYNIGTRNANVRASMGTAWERQEKTFASTDGAFTSQTIYRANPSYEVTVQRPRGRGRRTSDLFQRRAGGWEVLAEAPLRDELPRLIEEAFTMSEAKRIVPDRYDVVFDARTMAELVALTIGTATELDRILGYEANAGGTSYIASPLDQPEPFDFGTGLLNVRANRSQPDGLATVRWDDEGIEPEDYDVVRDGVVVDYHTTRELSTDLAEWHHRHGLSNRSRGCASSENGLAVTMLQPPNLELVPGSDATTFDELISGVKKGLAICGGRVTVDRQQLNGEINGELVYEIRDGKVVGTVHSSEALFRAPELWRSLKAVGGRGSELRAGITVQKGQPEQVCHFSVGAVPALFEKVAVTNKLRKA